MFILGFAIPVFLIVLFYGLLVRRLFARSRSIPASQVPVNRIAIYTMAISVFFVVCWSPYWIATLYGLYRSHYPQHHASTTFIYVMYGIHALPYVNSASNWLLYGLLNEELMRRAGNRKKTLTKIEEARQPVMPPMHHLRTVDDTALMPHITDSLL
ncbi:putative G-protein coupled receptor C06G4.5 [Toxocara canis]|nr:putative G-protein coupled receptor C06G4.5 [Toxocara canis]